MLFAEEGIYNFGKDLPIEEHALQPCEALPSRMGPRGSVSTTRTFGSVARRLNAPLQGRYGIGCCSG